MIARRCIGCNNFVKKGRKQNQCGKCATLRALSDANELYCSPVECPGTNGAAFGEDNPFRRDVIDRAAKRQKYHPLVGRIAQVQLGSKRTVNGDDATTTTAGSTALDSECDDLSDLNNMCSSYDGDDFSLEEFADYGTEDSDCREDESWSNSEVEECSVSEDVNEYEELLDPREGAFEVIWEGERPCVRRPCCRNCHRQEIENELVPYYRVKLKWFTTDGLSCQVKWKSFTKVELGRNTKEILLCVECSQILNKEPGIDKQDWCLVWPVYTWLLITNGEMIKRYGADVLRFIPGKWHKYWASALADLYPSVFDDAALQEYQDGVQITVEVTQERDEFKRVIKNMKLGELKKGCNDYLLPLVLCPWGCSSYAFHDGFVPFDSVIARFFPFVSFAGSHKKANVNTVKSCRSDYFSEQVDAWYYNPEWTVHPSVAYIRKVGPVFLTCRDHHRGTREQYFHLPKTDVHLPAKNADSLSHAVLRARTLRPCQARQYSHSWQLNKTLAHYGGVDCCIVSEKRYFDFQSHLTDVCEARSFAGREDIKGLVNRLAECGVLSMEFKENIAKRASELYTGNSKLSKLSSGGTMMTLHDCIKLQEMISMPNSVTITHGDKQMNIQRLWPRHLVMIHPNDDYGSDMLTYNIPTRGKTTKDLRCFWIVANSVLCVPAMWSIVDSAVHSSDQWNGHMLNMLNRQVLHRTSQGANRTNNPFHSKLKSKKISPEGLQKLMDLPREHANSTIGFKSDYFHSIFQAEIARGELRVENIRRCQRGTKGYLNNVVALAGPKCKAVMVLRPHGSTSSFALPDSIGIGIGQFELRFVTVTQKSGGSNSGANKWTGEIHARHGGTMFSKWFKFGRDTLTVKQCDLSQVDWSNFDVALYVRCNVATVDRYREEYLKYIGGQDKFYCHLHKVPLITSRCKRGEDARRCTHCTGTRSAGIFQEFSCPVDECNCGVCQECFRAGHSKTYVKPGEPVTRPRAGMIPRETDDDEPELPSGSENEDDSPERAGYFENQIECSGGSCDVDRKYARDNLPTGEENPIFDIEDSNPGLFLEEDDERDDPEVVLPTTHVAAEPTTFDTNIGIIGTSVLLNKCGTMLVRRDNVIRASRKERNLIERVVSAPNVGTVPLVYLEGVLFPSIFWCLPHAETGGVLGSMPTSLFCQHATRRQYNIASVADHAKTRLKSIGNVASMDNRYLSFQFDSLANGALAGQDTRVVLSRGFEECMGPAGMRMRNGEDDLYTDTIDSKQNVHNLCASERDQPSTLFVTLTCNQREHFGISRVKKYIDDGDALANYKAYRAENHPSEAPLTVEEESEVQGSLVEASRNLICRNWLEVKTLLLKYILNSPEKPFGDVVKIFSRDEYQCECGNLCHLHMLITLRYGYDTEQGRRLIQLLIRGHVGEIVGQDEVEQFIKEGLLDSWEDYEVMKDQACRILPHICNRRCKRRTGVGEEDLACRKPDTRKISPDLTSFFELNLDIAHDPQTVAILERLGMCKPLSETSGMFKPLEEFLKGKRIHAPARHGEGIISPVVGRLFAATRSSMNVQICTSFGTSRYIVKYLIKIDEHNYVAFHAKRDDPSTLKAEQVFLHNTKITSSAINEHKKLEGSRHKARAKGRALSATEMMQIILGYPQVFSNMEFIKVSTLPLGDRSGVEQESMLDRLEKRQLKSKMATFDQRENIGDTFDLIHPLVKVRRYMFENCKPNRCHTASQERLLEDQMYSCVSIDKVTVFGLRPPELLFVDKMEWYYKYFERSKRTLLDPNKDCASLLTQQYETSQLIDGFGHKISVRREATAKLADVLRSRYCERKCGELRLERMRTVLLEVCTMANDKKRDSSAVWPRVEELKWKSYQRLFLSELEKPLCPIVVFSNVRPKNASKFVIHLLLSMGHFHTEADLWTQGDMRSAFAAAQLTPDMSGMCDEEREGIIDDLLKRWIKDQLQYYPIGTKRLDEFIVSARRIIQGVLVYNSITIEEMPPYLYTTLVSNYDEEITFYRKECKDILVDATFGSLRKVYGDDLSAIVPDKSDLMSATKSRPLQWSALFPKTSRQSEASYSEQCTVQEQARDSVHRYTVSFERTAPNYIITGPPGAGKTHCMNHAIIYSLSRGLFAMTTAFLADRAFLLGGQHFHKLFKLPVRDTRSPQRMAELAVIALQKHPKMLSLLRYLDVLLVDEIGQLSAEMLSVLDILMRRIRNSSLFMGGVLVIGTLDQVQLRPIKGLPFLLSPYVLTTFAMGVLEHYVRCSACVISQEINQIARFFTSDRILWEQKLQRLESLLREHCTFVVDWSDAVINDDVLRVFPKREQKDKAIRDFMLRKRQDNRAKGVKTVSAIAQDEMIGLESHGDAVPANKAVVKYLNWKSDEPKTLDLFKGGIYQFTYNSPGRFNATQIGVLVDEPDSEKVAAFADIEIMVAPPGVKSMQVAGLTKESMLAAGWRETTVGTAPEYTRTVWSENVKAKRKQYALVLNVASTIHSAIGHTVLKIATELSNGSIWERAMVVVLLSRVQRASDIVFVGDKEKNINAIISGLATRSQYDDYMNHVVDVLRSTTSTNRRTMPLYMPMHPFRVKDIPLPTDNSGYVYMLLSASDGATLYIGKTDSISIRLAQHNSGFGALQTRADPKKRPWTLYAYVSGFRNDNNMMMRFEHQWQIAARQVRDVNAAAAANCAMTLIERHYEDDRLVLVQGK